MQYEKAKSLYRCNVGVQKCGVIGNYIPQKVRGNQSRNHSSTDGESPQHNSDETKLQGK